MAILREAIAEEFKGLRASCSVCGRRLKRRVYTDGKAFCSRPGCQSERYPRAAHPPCASCGMATRGFCEALGLPFCKRPSCIRDRRIRLRIASRKAGEFETTAIINGKSKRVMVWKP